MIKSPDNDLDLNFIRGQFTPKFKLTELHVFCWA